MGEQRIGVSGWAYPPWRKVFYPKGVRQRDELSFASRLFNSIEVNASFYSLLHPDTCAAWYKDTPDDFLFAVKGSRFITHMKRLKNVDIALSNFFASGLLLLEEKLGPILWQLPPNLPFEVKRLEAFLERLPRTTKAAAKLAGEHDYRVDGRAVTTIKADRPLRYAFEVRHPTFLGATFPRLMKAHDVAVSVADTAGTWPQIDEHTADFTYVRLHGDSELYTSGYSASALRKWAAKIKAWKKKGDVYVYFDNDAKVRAPFDALALKRLLGDKAGEDERRIPPVGDLHPLWAGVR